MNLVPWDPFRELEEMTTRLNRYFRRPEGERHGTMATADWMPVVDVEETEEEYLIKADLPKVEKKDIEVTAHDGVLTLRGERRQETSEKTKKIHRVERHYGSFMRSFAIPDGIDESKILATYEEGVLTVHLPKSAAAPKKARTVEIR